MVVFFSINHSEKTKRNIFQILQQLPFSLDPFSTKNINIEILGDIHRSHFIAKFPNMYWLRIHVYKKKDGKWMKIINSAHIYLRYHIGKRQYINPPSHQHDSYLPDTSKFPQGNWEYFDHTLRP
jgi:hypothetical protein